MAEDVIVIVTEEVEKVTINIVEEVTKSGSPTVNQLAYWSAGNKISGTDLVGDVTTTGNVTTIGVGKVNLPMLSASGTKTAATFLSGDNSFLPITMAIVTGTKAEFDTACSDGDFIYVGDDLNLLDEDVVGFNLLAGHSVSQGQLAWNADEETLDLGLNGAVLQLGQEFHYHVRNNSGAQINNGTAVMASGTIGASGRITIAKMDGSDIANAKFFLGITTEDIPNGEDGKVTSLGKVRGINTSSWNEGDVLWVDTTIVGGLTNTQPTSKVRLPIAFVVTKHASSGTLAIRSTDGTYFSESHDTEFTSLTTNDYLKWGGTSWVNVSTIPSTQIGIATGGGTPTVDTVQEYIDNTGSSGFFTGGEITDGGLGTVDVAAGEGFIRTTNDVNAELQSFKWAASAGIAVTDNTTQYVYVDDSGVITLSTDEFLETPDKIQIGVVTDEGGSIINTFNLGVRLSESIGQAGRFIRRVHGITRDKRKGGLIFGQSGDANRDITITSGVIWWGRTEYPFSSFDTAAVDTFETYSATGQEDSAASQWNNLQYDNAGTLTTMTNNRWANLFFYIIPNNGVIMVYGRAEYVSQALAEAEGVPSTSLPSKISETGLLAARLIFQKSSNTAIISSAFDTLFANAGVTDHGNLAGLTNDDHTQYLLVDGSRIMTGALDEFKGANIVSATTTDIGAATGNYVDVTGTTTITGLGTIAAGVRRIVNFTGILTLTYNATSLILPTAANITTAVNDVATFVSLGSGNWRCVSYERASGEALVGGAGGGGEFVYYRRTGFIDAVSTSWWQMLDLSNAYRTEWDLTTNVAKGDSTATISDSMLNLTTAFGWAYANQTVVSLKVIGRADQVNITHVGIIKVTWNSGHTATTSKTLLYETDSISFTNNAFNVLAASFTNTAISENDDIYVFFATDSTDDRYLHVELKCSID